MPNYDPIHLTFNDKPHAITQGMVDLLAKRQQVKGAYKGRRWLPLGLFLAGIPFICIDLAFMMAGYSVLVFSLATAAFWVAAIAAWISIRRNRVLEVPPRYDTARQILYTLRDDVDPKRNFFGQLDLTGTRQDSKVARETPNALGLITRLYRDEWLSLKTKLYDGNMLRLSAVQRDKVRKGYWKRSRISGKNKWKPEKEKGSLHELKVRLSVNPNIYDIPATAGLMVGQQIGPFYVERYENNSGLIDLSARSATGEISAQDILNVLHSLYGLLKRKV